MSITYFDPSGRPVPEADALIGGTIRDGYSKSVRTSFMDSGSRQTAAATSIQDAIGLIDTHPRVMGACSRTISKPTTDAKSGDRHILENAARNGRAYAGHLRIMAEGYGPHAVTDAQKASFRQASKYVDGLVDVLDALVGQLQSGRAA